METDCVVCGVESNVLYTVYLTFLYTSSFHGSGCLFSASQHRDAGLIPGHSADISVCGGQDGAVRNIFSNNAIYHGHYRSNTATYSDLFSNQENKHVKPGELNIK